MGNSINWHRLAEQVGTLNDTGESGGDRYARQALELIIGEEQLRMAVDYYVQHHRGSELARSVLLLLHSWAAMQRCYELYQSQEELEIRRSAIELLRVVADRRALPWIEEFLNDPDPVIQGNGMEVVEKLAWSELVFPEECQALLEKAAQHSHPDVRELAKEISELFRNRDS